VPQGVGPAVELEPKQGDGDEASTNGPKVQGAIPANNEDHEALSLKEKAYKLCATS